MLGHIINICSYNGGILITTRDQSYMGFFSLEQKRPVFYRKLFFPNLSYEDYQKIGFDIFQNKYKERLPDKMKYE